MTDHESAAAASTAGGDGAGAGGTEADDAMAAWLLEHWLGHRRLTRRTIEAFPERELHDYTSKGMRPFASMVHEIVTLTAPLVEGTVTRVWQWPKERGPAPTTKEALLAAWDEAAAVIADRWPSLPGGRLLERHEPIAGRSERVIDTVLYFVDNEIHHRGQGYVYLRQLGVTPPPFYRR